jgi:hypothetical protein
VQSPFIQKKKQFEMILNYIWKSLEIDQNEKKEDEKVIQKIMNFIKIRNQFVHGDFNIDIDSDETELRYFENGWQERIIDEKLRGKIYENFGLILNFLRRKIKLVEKINKYSEKIKIKQFEKNLLKNI